MSSKPSILKDKTESIDGGSTPNRSSIIHKKSRSARDLKNVYKFSFYKISHHWAFLCACKVTAIQSDINFEKVCAKTRKALLQHIPDYQFQPLIIQLPLPLASLCHENNSITGKTFHQERDKINWIFH